MGTGTELLQLIISIIEFIWPFRRVDAWERGVYLVNGKHWHGLRLRWLPKRLYGWPTDVDGTVGPGVWPVIPWFIEVHSDTVKPGIISTVLQSITLRDNRTLHFSATAGYYIDNYAKALIDVEDFKSTMLEALAGIGELLADTDPQRFDPARGKRDRLRSDIAKQLDEQSSQYGVRIQWVKFPNFIVEAKTYRLLTEKATINAGA